MIFLLVVVSLFPLGVGPGQQILARIAVGVIWIAALLATVLSLDGLFRSDFEDGSLEQLVVSGHSLALVALLVLAWTCLPGSPLGWTMAVLAVSCGWALAMMASFRGVAGLYVLLSMGFMAAAQLLVYIGAISILVMFAIMMTRRMMQTRETPFNAQWRWGLV